MRGDELADEAAWLLDSGAYDAGTVADMLGTTVGALRKLAARTARSDLAVMIQS